MALRRYSIVALQMPIVYTIDGDHDRDGLMFAMRGHLPLLEWLRARWEDEDRYLPRLQLRRQHIQVLVDDLDHYLLVHERLEAMVQEAGGERQRLLRELRDYAGDSRAERPEDDAQRRRLDPEVGAIEHNVRHVVDQIALLFDILTDGRQRSLPTRHGRIDVAELERRRKEWQVALEDAHEGIEAWFRRVESDPRRRYDRARLARETGLTPEQVDRLLLNDRWPADAAGVAAALREGRPAANHYTRVDPMKPVPLVRPLVLRAHQGDTIRLEFENQIRGRDVGVHLQGDGISTDGARGVEVDDGAAVGRNPTSLVPAGERRRYLWHAHREGVWVFNDLGDLRGTERGTNAHGLFGALMVEPPGVHWKDPETGDDLTWSPFGSGPDVDIHVPGEKPYPTIDQRDEPGAEEYVDLSRRLVSHREFTVVFHDEPEVHSGFHVGDVEHTVMPLNYRAEPMPNRLPHRMRRLVDGTAEQPAGGVERQAFHRELDAQLGEVFRTARRGDDWLEYVAGEEQHHSSWLFGDPQTPIPRAYRGDPARVRLIHAGVKETHVFHLHVHQWRAIQDPDDTPGVARGSQLLDSITIGPQTAVTIEPLYGSGSRQHAFGDIIWHCHLYPHFHHGMWGLWRSFDVEVDGTRPHPDGSVCHPLRPLPHRPPERGRVGFPWFVDAVYPQKSPPPPALDEAHAVGRRRLVYEGTLASADELAAVPATVAADPQPGAVFVDLDGDAARWNSREPTRLVHYEVTVRSKCVPYNRWGWRDDRGHFYEVTAASVDDVPIDLPQPDGGEPVTRAPLFARANHGDLVELTLTNELGRDHEGGIFPPDAFDLAQLPVECGLHVHLVKFDVLAADGSSTGWNYLSGASCPAPMEELAGHGLAANTSFHRWVVDEEFGPCFFHDHLLANFRQKHGLFAALVAEPRGSRWVTPESYGRDQETTATVGVEAVVHGDGTTPFREACLAVGDFVPLTAPDGEGRRPLNPPGTLGGDDDPGAMAVNYRCAPLTKRGDDPSRWFSSSPHDDPDAGDDDGDERVEPLPPAAGRPEDLERRDPDTPVFRTHPGERLRIRLIQGSHEEQHSFLVHGMRWRRDWLERSSTLVDQQTLGISEAFTLEVPALSRPGQQVPDSYGPGDHLWAFAAMDDLWLGCWGLIRSLPAKPGDSRKPLAPEPAARPLGRDFPPRPVARDDGTYDPENLRQYVVVARRHEHRYSGDALTDPWGLVYEEAEGSVPVPVDEPGGRRGDRRARGVHHTGEPLVLRARAGEWVRVVLINELLRPEDEVGTRQQRFGPEPSPPPLPLDENVRVVSPRVSLHPSLLRYDVISDDGANVGLNRDSTVPPLLTDGGDEHDAAHADEQGLVAHRPDHAADGDPNWREYWWYADPELARGSHHLQDIGQVCYLQDMADVRNHRHHGLVGALVVEPPGVRAVDPTTGDERWTGTHVHLLDGDGARVADEMVLVVQDGLRLFVAGNPTAPLPDVEPGDDPEDAGQKGINYRTHLIHHETGMAVEHPHTPVWSATVGDSLWLRLVYAADKPRNHTFTLHGTSWPLAPWHPRSPWIGSASGLSTATVHDIAIEARRPGDHAYRTGVLKWALEQGLWGLLRIEGRPGAAPAALQRAADALGLGGIGHQVAAALEEVRRRTGL
ncbi:multicopper oxidase domain-containing protein [Actinomycetospora sp. CA-101289]|uniref:multicopper oxidase domain-containing protein n=1 Tax=Actinomycetospora sp. CA-101289 TaxID=3239893 RepID=UPI003D99E144